VSLDENLEPDDVANQIDDARKVLDACDW